METVIDFNEWFADFKIPEPVYVAVYDKFTGQVTSVGPDHAFTDENNKIVIDSETAELIIDGTITIGSCVVDMQNNVMEIAEIKSVFKIDDVLHRIISLEYAEFEKADVLLEYSNQSLKISLSDEYRTTRKINWDGETVMNFLITDYNDPNILYNMLSLKVSDLVEAPVILKNLDIPTRFSVYTRRLFKNYVIEYK